MMRRSCAIHQPNLFAREITLAKIMAADCWVVLDDVQFCRRDYQHRARLGLVDRPTDWRWLTLPVHLPDGRATKINDVHLVDRLTSQRRVRYLLRQYYRRRPGWFIIADVVDRIADYIAESPSLALVAELSMRLLLDLHGWRGEIVRSSKLSQATTISDERSQRLADLTEAAGGDIYVCGQGGRRYLCDTPFAAKGMTVSFFGSPVYEQCAGLTALAALAEWRDRRTVGRLRARTPVGVSGRHRP